MTGQTCPPLPTGSVDLSVLHEADAKGADLNEAVERATTRVEPLTQAEFEELPSLTGKTKADLLKIAAAEGVDADDSMTNAAIVSAIEAVRAGEPVVDDRGSLVHPTADENASGGDSSGDDA